MVSVPSLPSRVHINKMGSPRVVSRPGRRSREKPRSWARLRTGRECDIYGFGTAEEVIARPTYESKALASFTCDCCLGERGGVVHIDLYIE